MADRDEASSAGSGVCPSCGSEVAAGLLHCPACRWLVHSDELKRLAARAEEALRRGELAQARDGWRRALELLPAGSEQLESVRRRVEELGRRLEKHGAQGPAPVSGPSRSVDSAAIGPGTSSGGQRRSRVGTAGAAIGGFGLLLWKFKLVAGFILGKGKLLLLGLTEAGTLFSMLLSMGLYWGLFGWKFAVGLVISIYVHEMGHVAALLRLGIRASAPMFIPGFGAMVRLHQYPASAREDARVGLAGPLWGLGASVVALAGFHATGWPILAAIARVGAWLNLLNLIPLWQLDGSRGFRALDRRGRWLVVGAQAALWLATGESLFFLLVLAGGYRCIADRAPAEGDTRALLELLLLVASLGALCTIPVPGAL